MNDDYTDRDVGIGSANPTTTDIENSGCEPLPLMLVLEVKPFCTSTAAGSTAFHCVWQKKKLFTSSREIAICHRSDKYKVSDEEKTHHFLSPNLSLSEESI